MRYSTLQIAVLLAAALVIGGCSDKHAGAKKADSPVVTVKGTVVETVRSSSLPETFDVVGTVRARTSAVVSARIPGSISELRVREGDRVRKGQDLAKIEAQENQATAAAASAGIDDARRGVDEALSRRKLADSTFERYSKLYDEQAISRQEYDVKLSEKELAHQAVARAEARLRQAQEGAKAASAISDYTRITAPIAGIITSKQADLGATVFPSQPLMTIEDENSYQLELAIPESLTSKIRPGSPVQVSLDALGSVFQARIAEIVPTADPASRSFTAKIMLSQNGIKSGMFGRGTVNLGSTATGLAVPARAVISHGALTSVWVVDTNNSARMRIVKVGKAHADRVEILSGLSDGERVVVSGAEKISEGAKVE